jgi:hypothetical protein
MMKWLSQLETEFLDNELSRAPKIAIWNSVAVDFDSYKITILCDLF